MTGTTHFKVGVLTYAIVLSIPFFEGIPFISDGEGITLPKLVVAGVAALMVDADSQHSKINRLNPATRITSEGIEWVERLLKAIVKLLITAGSGALVLFYSSTIIGQLSSITSLEPFAGIITYGLAVVLILLGFSHERTLGKIPLIGKLYKTITSSIDKGSSMIKRLVMILIYAGTGIGIGIYNFNYINDLYLYLIALVLMGIAAFPHRSFLHSLEGWVLFTAAMGYLFEKIGLGFLTGAFFIGYASHIYLADILTHEGVPLLFTPKLLQKMGVKLPYIKLKIPLMSTGTKSGNVFEFCYVLGLAIVAVIIFILFKVL